MSDIEQAELLYGMPAIARFLGLKAPQARHLANKGTFPTFKIGKLVCARRSTLSAWIASAEMQASLGNGPSEWET